MKTNDTRSARKVVEHPAHRRNIHAAAAKWHLCKQQYAKACERMWAGMLIEFSNDELSIMRELGYFSEHDEWLIAQSLSARK